MSFTGIAGSGKSTLARATDAQLLGLGIRSYLLDADGNAGDQCGEPGCPGNAGMENHLRTGDVARLFVDAGIVLIVTFAPTVRADRERERVRRMLSPGDFMEIFCNCPPEVSEARSSGGAYRLDRNGAIRGPSAFPAAHEPPESPELVVDTALLSPEESISTVMQFLHDRGVTNSTRSHFAEKVLRSARLNGLRA